MNRRMHIKILFNSALLLLISYFAHYFFYSNSTAHDSLSKYLYSYIKFSDTISSSPPEVGIIEITNEDVESLGWPIPYDVYQKFFEVLKTKGSPYLIQSLIFSQLESNSQKISEPIKNFGKAIGANFSIVSASELSDVEIPDFVEFEVLPKLVFSNLSTRPESLPLLPISFQGIGKIANSYLSNGYSINYQRYLPNNCINLYLPTNNHDIVLPSNIFAFLSEYYSHNVQTTLGAKHIKAEMANNSSSPKKFTSVICSSSPNTNTSKYIQSRSISRYSFSEILNNTIPTKNEKVFILNVDWDKKIKDTGKNLFSQNIVAQPNHLTTRLLDEILTSSHISFSHFDTRVRAILFIVLLVSTLYFSVREQFKTIIGATVLSTISVVFYSVFMLNTNATIEIPSFLLLFQFASVTLLILQGVFLKWYDYRFYKAQTRRISFLFRHASTPNEIEDIFEEEITNNFPNFVLEISGMITELSNNLDSGNMHKALTIYKGQNSYKKTENDKQNPSQYYQPILDENQRQIGEILIICDQKIQKMPLELKKFIETIMVKIEESLDMIFLSYSNKIEAYSKQQAESFTSILSKFLPDSLVNKLNTSDDIEQSFSKILIPKPSSVALLQADIRGFSALSKVYSPIELVQYVQLYYKNVVSEAQKYAQIKLIGDCIFLFVEEDYNESRTAVDICLEIAHNLCKNTIELNLKNSNDTKVKFGIGIHYGAAVVGNLSSNDCIDYTALGNEVNKVARIEELTKYENIQKIIGENGLLISNEAVSHIKKYRDLCSPQKILLEELDLSVRSFSEVKEIFAINSKDLANLKL